jgi:hypothetical protein
VLKILLCYLRRLLSCLMLVALSFFFTDGALADSCYLDAVLEGLPDPEKSVMELVDVAFEGKVIGKWTETEELPGIGPRTRKVTIAFLVSTVHKGNVPNNRIVKVTGGVGFCSCTKDFEMGKYYRVLAALAADEPMMELELRHCTFSYEVDHEA